MEASLSWMDWDSKVLSTKRSWTAMSYVRYTVDLSGLYDQNRLILCFPPLLASFPCCAAARTLLSSLTGNLFIASSTTRTPSPNFPFASLSFSSYDHVFHSSSNFPLFSHVSFHACGNSILGLNL